MNITVQIPDSIARSLRILKLRRKSAYVRNWLPRPTERDCSCDKASELARISHVAVSSPEAAADPAALRREALNEDSPCAGGQ